MRIFFATDIHGSEVCWRKFLNAGAFHKADVLIMGGDMTGKAMVPIVGSNGGWEVTLQEQRHVLATEDELQAMEKRIRDRGYYPIRLTRDELAAWSADQALVDARFKDEMLRSVEALDGARRRAPRRHGHPLRRLARERRHVRDRPDHRSRPARAARRGEHDPARRVHARLDRLGEPDAVEHVPRAARGRASRRGSTVSLRRCRTEPRDLQLPRAAVRLEPRRRAAARRRHEVRGRRPGARAGRLEGGPRDRSSTTDLPSRSTATSTRARAR